MKNEYLLNLESIYNEYLEKSENRNISYGEIAWIESLNANELIELENELMEVYK